MTQKDLDFIKDAFSQIIDDIGGNPDWYEAARAVASDLGTLERELKEKVIELPPNLDEAAEDSWAVYEYRESPRGLYSTCYVDGFKAGAKWLAGQGVSADSEVSKLANRAWVTARNEKQFMQDVYDNFVAGEEVIIQIRKKQ